MANDRKIIEFVKTTSDKLDDVLEMENGRYQQSFIHTHDVGENGITDDQLYIGEDRITDKFNLGDTVLSTQTLKVGGLESTTFNALKNKSISEILIEILSPISVSSVTLNMNSSTMRVGGSTLVLTATVLPSNASDTTVTWSSSDISIATVDGGVVTAVGLGDVIITASAGNKSATCNITVEATPVSSVTLNKTTLSFNTPNSTQTLTATVNPSTATDKTVTWSSSNTNVVTVNNSGNVSVVGVGNATITANASGKTATCSVSVSAIIPSKKTNPSASISYNGDTFIGVGDALPNPQNDIVVTTNRGTWNNYGGYYAGEPGPIVWTTSPNLWPQTASEGEYKIYGQVTFGDGIVPVDNFGISHPEKQYHSGTVTTNTITITAINPIFVNGYLTDDGDDNLDITHMRKYVFNYTNETTLEITVPAEVETPIPFKFKVAVARQLSKFEVKQFNPLTQTYDIDVPMKYATDHYERVNDYTNTKPTKYKLTLKK